VRVTRFVVSADDSAGQQKVNKSIPERPSTRERICLNHAIWPAAARTQERLESTFNPKVAGSIPARPMIGSRCGASFRRGTILPRCRFRRARATDGATRSLNITGVKSARQERALSNASRHTAYWPSQSGSSSARSANSLICPDHTPRLSSPGRPSVSSVVRG
jgi:hypothetical protein